MAIPQELVDKMMVKCGRRCCICRRFLPLRLQVHHIDERSQGGGDNEDNLIVICLTCHTDVHSQVPFVRRFTVQELKGHRDELVRLVAAGTLPGDESYSEATIAARAVQGMPAESGISPAAVELLLLSAHATGGRQGIIVVSEDLSGLSIEPGNSESPWQPGDRRGEAKYRAALKELEDACLIEYASDSMREVTHEGYLRADELAVQEGKLKA